MQNTIWWNPVILVKVPSDSESLLDKKHLVKIKEIETEIKALKDWPLFCKAKAADDQSCSDQAILSPVSYLDNMLGKDWMSKSQSDLDTAWASLRNNQMMWPMTRFLYSKEQLIEDTGKVSHMRFLINFGAPIDMRSKKSLDGDE